MCHSPLQHSYNLYPLNMCVYIFFIFVYTLPHIHTLTHSTPLPPPKLAAWLRIAIYQKGSGWSFSTPHGLHFLDFTFGFWGEDHPGKLLGITGSSKKGPDWVNEGNAISNQLPRINKTVKPTKLHWIYSPRQKVSGMMTFKSSVWGLFFSGFEINSIESFSHLFARHPQGLPGVYNGFA